MGLDATQTRTFEDIAVAFTKQYDYNTQLDVTLKELELTKQESGESVITFLTRWRAKAAQMTNRPSEKEQVLLLKKNLLPQFRKPLVPIPISTFQDLLDAGMSIEDDLQMTAGTKAEGPSGGKGKKGNPEKATEVNAAFGPTYHHNQSYQSYLPNKPSYPSAYSTYQAALPQYTTPATSNYPRPNPRMPAQNPTPGKRRFDPLGKPLSEVFSKLMRRGVIRPLDPRPFNSPLPPHIDPNLYCDFHQGVGHHTDQCRRLQYAIQDLIDQKVIPPPQAPNINHNPLPNHYYQTNFISTNIPFDLSRYIIPSTLPKPHVVIWEVNDTCVIRQYDQGSFRGSPDNEEEPKYAKGKDICWQEDSGEEVKTTLTLGLGYEPTKEELREAHERIKGKGKEVQDSPLRIPRYDGYFASPEPWFVSKKEFFSDFEIVTDCALPNSPIQSKTQFDWSDNLNGI